jgi:tetratricopeptide (TPR) repeat protein
MPLQRPRAFVVSPFGVKPGLDGSPIDFNSVFAELIQPALLDAGLEAFRADLEQRAGSIHSDMFQELLLADLVVADLSIDNANAWYEVGVRHALRARGVVLMFSGRDYLPFDVGPERALRYQLSGGKPDPAYVREDRKHLTEVALATLGSWRGRRISPVYHLLPNLQEPDWRTLRVGDVNEYWEKLADWEQRVAIAVKNNRPGDVLLLAEEPPTRVLQSEALRIAGCALVRLGRYRFALEVLERALEQDPEDLVCRQQKGIALGRLGRHAEAQAWLEAVKRDHPGDGETLALLGRTLKDEWVSAWRSSGSGADELREAAADEAALLLEGARAYAEAFRAQPGNFYPGINAVTLGALWEDLTGRTDSDLKIDAMRHGVSWAAECALIEDRRNYWARATIAELELLTSDTDTVRQAYQDATAVAGDWFALDSSKQQLCLLRDLGFRFAEVQAAIDVLAKRQGKMHRYQSREPRHVVLFSGHMVDGADRKTPRFPEAKTDAARQRLRATLEQFGVGPDDLAISGAACGGDLLFAEACLDRGLRLELRLPLLENEFLDASVNFAAPHWRDLYDRVKAHTNTTLLMLPQELRPTLSGVSAHERNNLWMLYSGLALGANKVLGVLLWDREPADGPGGTQHMHDLIARLTGRTPIVIDPATL